MNPEMLAAVAIGLLAVVILLMPLWSMGPARATLDFSDIELEETAKGQALLALRELEFDHATGKLSDADYDDLRARYQIRAVNVLERGADGGRTPSCRTCGPRPEANAVICSSCGRPLEETTYCTRCGHAATSDHAFCEQCGAQLTAAPTAPRG